MHQNFKEFRAKYIYETSNCLNLSSARFTVSLDGDRPQSALFCQGHLEFVQQQQQHSNEWDTIYTNTVSLETELTQSCVHDQHKAL